MLGAIAFSLIAVKKPNQKQSLWTKYFVYVILTVIVISSILIDKTYFFWLAILISLVGGIELVILGTKHAKFPFFKLFLIISIYDFIAVIFCLMAYQASPNYLLVSYFGVIVFDAFSQISGQLFGKTKLTSISPNKTVEGLIGGIAMTMTTLLIIQWITGDNWPVIGNVLLFSSLLCLTSFSGDILASWYKRICGVKDFSNLLPGQGGVLDRYDSLMATGFVFFIINFIYA